MWPADWSTSGPGMSFMFGQGKLLNQIFPYDDDAVSDSSYAAVVISFGSISEAGTLTFEGNLPQ